MTSKQPPQASIDQYITYIITKNNPKTIEELVRLLQSRYPIPEQKILEHILRLQNQRKIVLKENPASSRPLFKQYIFSTKASWYWTVIAVAIVTTILVFTVPESAYPIVYARNVLGTIFVLFLPGNSLMKALFPTKELDNIERVALSIGMSLALVSIAGLLLYYTSWGRQLTPTVLILLALTAFFSTVGIIREHESQLRENP